MRFNDEMIQAQNDLSKWDSGAQRIRKDMATMEGQAREPIYAIAATDRDNRIVRNT